MLRHALLRSLPFVALTIGPSAHAQFDILSVGEPVTVDFNIGGAAHCTSAIPWVDNMTIPYCYADRPTYNYSNGCANIGGLHVAGSNSADVPATR
jgi:hypothetical protein